MSPAALTIALKAEAARLGFDLSGATPAVAPPQIGRLRQWLADGFAGQMHSIAARAGAYEHPRHILPGVRSLLVLAVSYRTAEPGTGSFFDPGTDRRLVGAEKGACPLPAAAGQGTIARFAWGGDYHGRVRRRLQELADFHRRLTPGAVVRGVVDTAPLLERQFAQLAGLGALGKNTTLLNERLGSWFVLAALLTSELLAYDPPQESDPCGACRKCLDACPTGALVEPYRLDARRCISYLTIEHRGPLPAELRGPIGDRVFGCDACQEVCPWNRGLSQFSSNENGTVPLACGQILPSPISGEGLGVRADGDLPLQTLELAELFFLDESAFRQRFRGTALLRAGRQGLLRNAAIILGNRPHPAALPALRHGLADADPVICESCAWALERYSAER
jgi:epoxyqueuosine reductase